MNSFKIAIIAPRFPPYGELGGIEIATQYISDSLAQKGHRVFIVTSGPKNIIEIFGHHVTIHRVLQPRIKFLGDFIFWINIYFTLRKIKPDIVHCQAIQMGVSGFLFQKTHKRPYIVWCHGFDVYFPWKGKKVISKIILNSAGAVVALTNHMKEELKKTFKKDIIVLPNGIDIKRFKGFSKQAIRDKFNISFSEKIIVFAGGLRPVKGLEYLLLAFKIISQNFTKARLLLAGEGSERKKLEDIVKENSLAGKVIFIGQILHQKVAEYMAISDIFVLPSLSEGFPLVVLEAMASGLPIVATNVRGLPEIVKDGENGFLVEPKNPAQIAEKVLLLLGSDTLREKMSNINKEKSKEYDWDNIIEKIEEIYSKILTGKK